MSEEIEFYEGSGNNIRSYCLEDADELLARAKIGVAVLKILQSRKLKQREMANLLGIKQAEVMRAIRPEADIWLFIYV